jgi:hypothetical protein
MSRQILAPLLFFCGAGFVLMGAAPEKISCAQYRKPQAASRQNRLCSNEHLP